MDFSQTEPRRMLSETLRRYLTEQYGPDLRDQVIGTLPYHAPAKWAELAELGVIGAFLPEDQGGFGGDGFDITTVFEELGRALCPEPVLAGLLAIRAVAACGSDVLTQSILAGETRACFAVFEPEADDPSLIRTRAEKVVDGWLLNGRKSVVYGLPGADTVVTAARCGQTIGLFVVENPEAITYAMIDGGGAGEVFLDDTPATCLREDAGSVIDAVLDAGRLALCAEAVGAMDVLFAMTVDYLKQRQQFGRPIAQFQALQHRMVDMAIEIEQCRSITILAASELGGDAAARHVAMAKNLIGRTATLVAEECTQLHGGIGMTWEYPGSHYTKRLVMIDHQLGDRYEQVQKLMGA